MNDPRVDQDNQNDYDYFKELLRYNFAIPLTAGISFGITWLATFYILKQKFNLA